jgi:hypothetical protein
METIQGPDFEKSDIRVGTVTDAWEFPKARQGIKLLPPFSIKVTGLRTAFKPYFEKI